MTATPKGRRGYDPKVRAKVLRMYRTGRWSAERIAARPGMPSVKTIRRWIREAKLKPNGGRRYPRARIKKLLEQDVPRAKIRKKYGCSYKWLSDLSRGKLEIDETKPVKRTRQAP